MPPVRSPRSTRTRPQGRESTVPARAAWPPPPTASSTWWRWPARTARPGPGRRGPAARSNATAWPPRSCATRAPPEGPTSCWLTSWRPCQASPAGSTAYARAKPGPARPQPPGQRRRGLAGRHRHLLGVRWHRQGLGLGAGPGPVGRTRGLGRRPGGRGDLRAPGSALVRRRRRLLLGPRRRSGQAGGKGRGP